jgi:hypothetical protein
LLVFGLAAGHELAYRLTLAAPLRDDVLTSSGHGYLAYLPLALSVTLALAVAAFAWRVVALLRGSRGGRAPAGVFAALPPVAFAVQEHAERLIYDGRFPVELVSDPTFAVGLVLQVPIALAAVVLARACELLAHQVAASLARKPPRARFAPFVARIASGVTLPRLHPLAFASSGRGPPLP